MYGSHQLARPPQQLQQRIFDLMENHYEDSEFSIEQMSDTLCMSRVQLYRKTKSLFGMSPTEFASSLTSPESSNTCS